MSKEVNIIDPADAISDRRDGPKKFTNWKKEPTLEQLKHDYTASKPNQEKQISRVLDWIDCFNAEGFYKAPQVDGNSQVAPKLCRKQVEWRCPSLTEPFLSNKQLLEVAARTGEDVPASKQNQLILNYQFQNKLDLVKLMDELVRTMAIEGTVILKPHWNYEESTVRVVNDIYEPVLDESVIPEYQQMIEKLETDPDYIVMLNEGDKAGLQYYQETGEPYRYTLTEKEEVEQLKVISNKPDVDICDIEDVFVDPSCKGNINKAKFVVHRFLTCYGDLKADGRYTNLKELKDYVKTESQNATNREDSSGFQFRDTARKQIEAFEYWGYYDVDGSGILSPIVATWVGNVLIQLDRSPLTGSRYPFIFIPLTPVKGSLYGEPDAELLKDNQMIVGATMRGAIDLFGNSANGQIGTAKGFLDSHNKNKFNNGEHYEFNGDQPPESSIYAHKFPEIPRSVFDMITLMNNEAESLSGTQAFNQGIQGDALGKTVGGIRSAMSASAKRDAAILRRIAAGITKLAYAFQEMNAIFLSESDYVRITNEKFVPVDPNNLNGDFDLKIDISTAEEDAAKVQDLSFLLQTGQSSFPFEFTKKILAEIAYLKKLPSLEQFIEQYEPAPDPIAEAKAKLELQKLELENMKLQAEIQEISNKAAVNGAEVAVREARAANTQSNTDTNNLQFYKDSEGVSHQEALDKINAQSNAAIRTKDIDHLNNMDTLRFSHNSNLLTQRAIQDTDTIQKPRSEQ